jgi:hypothetical protein
MSSGGGGWRITKMGVAFGGYVGHEYAIRVLGKHI